MLFGRQNRSVPSHRRIAVVRDVVEVLAIVAAGIWAIYVFVYTDKIEPYQKPLAPVVDASINVVGAKRDLLAIRLSQSIRNPGPAPIFLLGSTATVFGSDVRDPDSRALRVTREQGQYLERRYSLSHFEEASAFAFTSVIGVNAGETWQHSWIAFVPRNRYDTLIFDPIFYFARDRGGIVPMHQIRNSHGTLLLEATGGCPGNDSSRCPEAAGSEIQISLWH